MKCKFCNGDGKVFEAVIYNILGGGLYFQCEYCKGTGKVNLFKYIQCKSYIEKKEKQQLKRGAGRL